MALLLQVTGSDDDDVVVDDDDDGGHLTTSRTCSNFIQNFIWC